MTAVVALGGVLRFLHLYLESFFALVLTAGTAAAASAKLFPTAEMTFGADSVLRF